MRKVGQGALEKAAIMEEELGSAVFAQSLSGDLCLRMAQAARRSDPKKAMDYLALAFAASEPMTDSGKVLAIGLRALLKHQKGDFTGSKADIDEMENLLVAEEVSLNAASKDAFGSEKTIDPLARPDLFMRANEWNSQREILLRLKKQGIGTRR